MSTIKIEMAATHVTIYSKKSFEDVRAALESHVPQLDAALLTKVSDGDILEAIDEMHSAPTLSIFSSRDHGSLLQIVNLDRKAIQYEIGNPLTASKMTRHRISAGLYAPVRVLLRQDEDGEVAFEYDSPSTAFSQFQDPRLDQVAGQLDSDLETVLLNAAGS